jgi:tetrahydromethanopterin S-methyltransferase subunit G
LCERLRLSVEPTAWTDQRLDDAITRVEQRFDSVDRRLDRMDRNFDRVWSEFAATHRLIAQAGWGIAAVLLIQVVATIIAFS